MLQLTGTKVAVLSAVCWWERMGREAVKMIESCPSFRVLYNDNRDVAGFVYNDVTYLVAGAGSSSVPMSKRARDRVRETTAVISQNLRGPAKFRAKRWEGEPGQGAIAECDWPDPSLSVWEVVGQQVWIDEHLVEVVAVEHTDLENETPTEAVGLIVESAPTCCLVCGLPRFKTVPGTTCPNGHKGGE